MRFFGNIGFEQTLEVEPGIWEESISKRPYQGDVIRNQRRWQEQQDSINDKINISNEVSVLADDYLLENLGSMRWVEFNGVKWKISWVNLQYPRVVLTLGGVYPEEAGDVDDDS